jgi:outer membrane biogenesis lipoprotein LolB
VHRCLLLLTAMFLAGCAASGTTAQSQPPQSQPQPQATAQLDDDTTCRAQGFEPGSAGYVQCRKQLDSQHLKDQPDTWTSERENTVRALLGRPPSGWGGYGQ